MANVKITALPEATSLNTGDLVCCVADATGSATTSKITLANLGNSIGIGNTPVNILNYDQTPTSTQYIDFSDTSGFYAGQGVVLTQSSQTYHLVTQVDTDKVYLSGPPLDTATPIVESPNLSFFILSYQRSVPVDLVFSGSYCLQGNTAGLIARENKSSLRWTGPPARLAYVAAKTATTDGSTSPASYPAINISIGGTASIASDLQLSTTSWTAVPNGGMIGSQNQVTFGDEIEVQLNASGGDGDSRDLTVSMVFILEQ